jgi:hypothetical protein
MERAQDLVNTSEQCSSSRKSIRLLELCDQYEVVHEDIDVVERELEWAAATYFRWLDSQWRF